MRNITAIIFLLASLSMGIDLAETQTANNTN